VKQQASHPPADHKPLILKRDLFGVVERVRLDDVDPPAYAVRRDPARARWWTRPLALWLARRENRALAALPSMDAVPQLIRLADGSQARSWQPGVPMHEARPRDPAYFRAAFRLVCRLHRAGVVHNDLAKEANWLVRGDGSPALIDFQLAWAPRRRGRLFRTLGREDIRHMLKHKRYYCAEHLSVRERAILARPAALSRYWMRLGKPVYLFITRRILNWSDREGAGDRQLP